MFKTAVAILGATSHIAKGLVERFIRGRVHQLHLYTRSAGKLSEFLGSARINTHNEYVIHDGYNDFARCIYDAVINCVGVGTAARLNGKYHRYFTVTEEYDNMAIRYLRNVSPETLYISLSSGAVYGGGFSSPADESSVNSIRVNNVLPKDYYGIARINAEAKHRAHSDLRIVDLRIFSYFSRYIDITDGYFITDLIQAVLNGEVLITDTADIVRDYIHPEDLFSIVNKCIDAGKINCAMDVSSSRPASKQDILDYFTSEYGLKYERRFREIAGATGAKSVYFSTSNRAAQLGYVPRFSSMDTLKDEAGYILAGRKR